MGDDSGCKLRELLPDKVEKMEEKLRSELREKELKPQGPLAWDFLASQAIDGISKTLDFDVFEALARAWSSVRKLREYAEEPKRSSEDLYTVHLGKHDFTTDIHPVLTYQIGDLPPHSLRFTLTLKANVESVALEIHKGRILAIGTGQCGVSAQLKYNNELLHTGWKSRKVKAPGRVPLKAPGFEIASPRAVKSEV